jgi:hypothetical protein
MADKCRRCAAPIRWGKTAKGRRMPLDAEPNPEGNVVMLDEFGNVRVLKKDEEPPRGVARWMPHWASCPHAEAFRNAPH